MTRMSDGNPWIGRPTLRCAATGRPFAPGDRYVAVLVASGDATDRMDYSAEAWSEGARPAGVVLGFWRSRVPAEQAAGPAPVRDEELAELFESMLDDDAETGTGVPAGAEPAARDAMRMLAAVALVRRRWLRSLGSRGGAMHVEWTKASGRAAGVISVPESPLDGPAFDEAADRFAALIGAGPARP